MSVQYAGEMQLIIEKARALIKEMDSTNDLSFIRLRTKKHEVLVAPGKDLFYSYQDTGHSHYLKYICFTVFLDKDYAMIVIQNQSEA